MKNWPEKKSKISKITPEVQHDKYVEEIKIIRLNELMNIGIDIHIYTQIYC